MSSYTSDNTPRDDETTGAGVTKVDNGGTESSGGRRGRPRQPYCPDCKKIGRQRLKHGTGGYCKEHQNLRVRASKRALVEGTDDIQNVREKILQEELDQAKADRDHYKELSRTHQDALARMMQAQEVEQAGGDPYAPPPEQVDELKELRQELGRRQHIIDKLLSVVRDGQDKLNLDMEVRYWLDQ